MKNIFVSLFFALCIPILANAQDDSAGHLHLHKFFADSAYSVITMERDTVDKTYEVLKKTTKTQSYHLASYWEGEKIVTLLLPETSTQVYLSDAEGEEGSITISALASDHGNYNKRLWSKTLDANATNYPYEYLEAHYYGCCGADDTKELIRYTDGARILLLSSDLYSVSIPNNRTKRYIGFLSDNSAKGYEDINDSLLCCTLIYTDPATLATQRAVITYKDGEIFDSLGTGSIEKLTLTPSNAKDKSNYHGSNDLDLWSGEGMSDSEGYSGFTIDLHVFGPQKIVLRIPVVKDKLDVKKVKSNLFNIILR